jgi:hypothetical protein
MRIKANTPSQLVLRDRTLWISAVCFAAALFMAFRVLAYHDPGGLGISALFLAGFGIVFLEATDIVFDKAGQVCRLRRLGSFRSSRDSFGFADIRDVRVEIAPMHGRTGSTMCRLALVTASGTIPLTRSYEPTLERYNAMRDAIVLALAADLPPSADIDLVQDLVDQGRTIDAITLLQKRDKLGLTEAHERVAQLEAAAARGGSEAKRRQHR